MANLILIGLGGFLGAIARYLISGLAHRLLGSSFPYGTLAVNFFGCILIGACMHLIEEREIFSPAARSLILVGILGSFTTFSTFGYESFAFLKNAEWRMALLNCMANTVLGIVAVYVGWNISRAVGT